MPSLLRRLFSRKTFARLAWTIAALIALLVATIAFENWRGDRAWAAYRAEADRRGIPYQRTAFLPPPVPEAENFAAIPLFREIFAAHAEHREEPHPFQWPVNAYETPTATNRRKGARLNLAKLRDQVVAAKLAQPTDNPARDILTGLATFEPALQQLRDAARRPHCRFPVNWEKGLMADVPQLWIFEPAVRLHALRLSTHLALGDSPAALADWRDVLALYRILEHEPGLTSAFVCTHRGIL